MECLEAPVGGSANIDLWVSSSMLSQDDDATGTKIIDCGGSWTLGEVVYYNGAALTDSSYLYLVKSSGANTSYSAGKFLITFLCRHTL